MSSNPTPASQHFNSEMLLFLRESVRVYLKLDLTCLAASGKTVTALKINDEALIELGAGFTLGAVAFILLLAFDTHTKQLISQD